MAALAAVALGDVEGTRAERASKLLAQVAIVMADPHDDGAKHFDGADAQVQNEEAWGVRRSCLHALPSERTVTAPPVCFGASRRRRGSFALGQASKTAAPLVHELRTPTRAALGVRIRMRLGVGVGSRIGDRTPRSGIRIGLRLGQQPVRGGRRPH